MIKNLTINQFQSHKDSEFEFCPGVNVIVGSSDRGKTSVLRALKWLIFNRAPGDFVSHWIEKGQSALVQAELDDGTIVGRELDGRTNSYHLTGYEEAFTAFGKQIPEAVERALNMSELNFQSQHDPPFLLSASSGEVARTLNQVANLSKIDTSLKWIGKQKRKTWSDLEHAKEEMRASKEALGALPDLGPVEVKMKRLRAIAERQKEINNSIEVLESIIESCQELQARKERLVDPSEAKSKMEEVDQSIVSRQELEGQVRNLRSWIREHKKLEEQKAQSEQDRQELHDEYKELMKGACPLCGRGD